MEIEIVPKWIMKNKERFLKYFGLRAKIYNISYRAKVSAKDFSDRPFKGWLFTIDYESPSVSRNRMEILIDSKGHMRGVSGYGTGRTIYSNPSVYYCLYPELQKLKYD